MNAMLKLNAVNALAASCANAKQELDAYLESCQQDPAVEDLKIHAEGAFEVLLEVLDREQERQRHEVIRENHAVHAQ